MILFQYIFDLISVVHFCKACAEGKNTLQATI